MCGSGDIQGNPWTPTPSESLSSCSEDRSLGVAGTVATDLLARSLAVELYSILNAVTHFYLYFTCFHFFFPTSSFSWGRGELRLASCCFLIFGQ